MRSPTSTRRFEPVLRGTLGTVIFQDQVMELAQAFAGFFRATRRTACAG